MNADATYPENHLDMRPAHSPDVSFALSDAGVDPKDPQQRRLYLEAFYGFMWQATRKDLEARRAKAVNIRCELSYNCGAERVGSKWFEYAVDHIMWTDWFQPAKGPKFPWTSWQPQPDDDGDPDSKVYADYFNNQRAAELSNPAKHMVTSPVSFESYSPAAPVQATTIPVPFPPPTPSLPHTRPCVRLPPPIPARNPSPEVGDAPVASRETTSWFPSRKWAPSASAIADEAMSPQNLKTELTKGHNIPEVTVSQVRSKDAKAPATSHNLASPPSNNIGARRAVWSRNFESFHHDSLVCGPFEARLPSRKGIAESVWGSDGMEVQQLNKILGLSNLVISWSIDTTTGESGSFPAPDRLVVGFSDSIMAEDAAHPWVEKEILGLWQSVLEWVTNTWERDQSSLCEHLKRFIQIRVRVLAANAKTVRDTPRYRLAREMASHMKEKGSSEPFSLI